LPFRHLFSMATSNQIEWVPFPYSLRSTKKKKKWEATMEYLRKKASPWNTLWPTYCIAFRCRCRASYRRFVYRKDYDSIHIATWFHNRNFLKQDDAFLSFILGALLHFGIFVFQASWPFLLVTLF
jgi:hypothetical protein